METRDPTGKESAGVRKKNLTFLKQRLYMLERRKTDTVVESSVAGDLNSSSAPLRRSQSDRSEYNLKLQEKMAPHSGSVGPVGLPLETEEQLIKRMMARRQKIIAEILQTERDYLGDLELCIRIVVEPLKKRQIARLDVDSLFSNIESVHEISSKLLSLLEEATSDVEPAMQEIGQVFLQIKDVLEEAYKIYCYHHDDAHLLLEFYEKDEELKQCIKDCLQSLKKIYEEGGKPNLLDMGSLMIKPIQRVMKYPLLLCELLNATPRSHPDHKALQDALVAMKEMNMNINELKRRKDIVLKYKKNDEDESLKDKFSRLNIHSISKKSKRVTGHLKILTGGEPQVKDEVFNKEEKLFKSLEKTVKLCVKNIPLSLQHLEDSVFLGAQCITDLQDLLHENEDGANSSSDALINTGHPSKLFLNQVEKLVLTPLTALQTLFLGPQKLIQKRYDKLLDYNSLYQKASGDDTDLARKEYEALNAQLVEELQRFNEAAKKIVTSCLCCLITLLKDMMSSASQSFSTNESQLLAIKPEKTSPTISEIHDQVLEDVHNLNCIKENHCATFIERKLSFEKKRPVSLQPEFPRQKEVHRLMLFSMYNVDLLYQAKRNCNATQELDIDLYEGDVVAVIDQKDPFGCTGRWLVDTGILKGYVYSSFLKPYKPAKAQKNPGENDFCDGDFDNISLFVSSRSLDDNITKPTGHKRSGSDSSYNSLCEKESANSSELESFYETDEQQTFYAVHAFQARSKQELSLHEYQRVQILCFSDLSGNKEWWLAEAEGQKGYVPANYLGKMTYT
ncbi:PREDICTED: rho guanine nucleotide exchange factor 38 [Thamnophis sirtalis]|uniref:Rho guanine nucleotide exchange factor 38 n=1 Tax=Thamnophis sirtalis TaxID=35019 RepID=A0A6I9XU47_9SAUR|nr:PREDICTED: rho guanine nucleotide exchange factor 38 [Thamnophis sirtalis]